MMGGGVLVPFEPTDRDVVSTKLRSWNRDHPGNQAYADLLVKYAVQLPLPSNSDYAGYQSEFADKIIRIIVEERNGRFLKIHEGDTEPTDCIHMDYKACLHKVVHGLKNKQMALHKRKEATIGVHVPKRPPNPVMPWVMKMPTPPPPKPKPKPKPLPPPPPPPPALTKKRKKMSSPAPEESESAAEATEAAPETPAAAGETLPGTGKTARKGKGRPKGSKNKPKDEHDPPNKTKKAKLLPKGGKNTSLPGKVDSPPAKRSQKRSLPLSSPPSLPPLPPPKPIIRYEAKQREDGRINPYALELISQVCNLESARTTTYSHSDILERPGPKYTSTHIREPERERLIRLQLRHRFFSALAVRMPVVEFARRILEIWGGSLAETTVLLAGSPQPDNNNKITTNAIAMTGGVEGIEKKAKMNETVQELNETVEDEEAIVQSTTTEGIVATDATLNQLIDGGGGGDNNDAKKEPRSGISKKEPRFISKKEPRSIPKKEPRARGISKKEPRSRVVPRKEPRTSPAVVPCTATAGIGHISRNTMAEEIWGTPPTDDDGKAGGIPAGLGEHVQYQNSNNVQEDDDSEESHYSDARVEINHHDDDDDDDESSVNDEVESDSDDGGDDDNNKNWKNNEGHRNAEDANYESGELYGGGESEEGGDDDDASEATSDSEDD